MIEKELKRQLDLLFEGKRDMEAAYHELAARVHALELRTDSLTPAVPFTNPKVLP